MRLQQIAFEHYEEFVPNSSEEEQILRYAITGGVPKYIEFVDAFPMNAAGKILKYKMRQDAAARVGLTGDGADTAGNSIKK